MRLHILSDLHLESTPYLLPNHLDCDVIVAAGDIGEGTHGVEFLKSLNKPVVYVLGNHEYYRRGQRAEMDDTLRDIRLAATGTQVHVLENDAAVINGVRFLGTTLWTNFGNAHPGLLQEAASTQNDYRLVDAKSWYQEKERLDYLYSRGEKIWHREVLDEHAVAGHFHPLIALWHHERAVEWLNAELQKPFDGHTVVVSHHHPSFQSLREYGTEERLLRSSSLWTRQSPNDDNGRFRVASYASDLSALIEQSRDTVSLWVCGHLHARLDYLERGVRIVCNPRGAHRTMHVSQPGKLDSPRIFDPEFVIDLSAGIEANIEAHTRPRCDEMARLHEETKQFSSVLGHSDPMIHQAIREAVATRAEEFFTIASDIVTWFGVQFDSPGSVRSAPHSIMSLGQHRIDRYALPGFREKPVQEQAQSVIQSQQDTLVKVRELAALLKIRQLEAMKILDNLAAKLNSFGVPTRTEISATIRLPWRRLHTHIGTIYVGSDNAEDWDSVQMLTLKTLLEALDSTGVRFWVRIERDEFSTMDELQ
jgi:predicted phosphodiesterase